MQWRYIDSGPATGAANMAEDERLLIEAAKTGAGPVLRFYTWNPPAASLGRFQNEATAVHADACRKRGIDIVRRITGGRTVLHDQELTYCIVAPADSSLFPNDVIGTYKVIAEGLLAGLRILGLPAGMATRAEGPARSPVSETAPPSCFALPSLYELLVSGKKIIGSAQRRIPGAFLQHGSILIGYDAALEAEIIPGGGRADRVTCLRHELGGDIRLADVKKAFLKGLSSVLGNIPSS